MVSSKQPTTQRSQEHELLEHQLTAEAGIAAGCRRSRAFILLSAAIPAAILLVVLLSGWVLPAEPSAPSSDFRVEFPVPFDQGSPLNIVIESPGRLWFTMPSANAIGSLVVTDTNDYQFTRYEVPTPDSQPYDLVYDHARNGLWFTEQAGNKLRFLETASGTFLTETVVTTPNSAPAGIALSPDGTIWFVERDGNNLAQYDPESDTLSEFLYSPPNMESGDLEDVAVVNAGSIWFTAPGAHYVSGYNPNTGNFYHQSVQEGDGTDTFPAPKLVATNGGLVWIAAPDIQAIGFYYAGTLTQWRWYYLPVSEDGLADLAYSYDGLFHYLWYTDNSAGRVGMLQLSSTGTVLAAHSLGLSGSESGPMDVVAGSNNEPWIADYGGLAIASWKAPYYQGTYLPFVVR